MAWRTKLFEWAKEQGMTLKKLSEITGYSVRHLMRIRDGEWPITEAFIGRIVLRLGDEARSLFFLEPMHENDTLKVSTSENGSE